MWSLSKTKCTRCHAPGGSRKGSTTFLRKVIYKLLIKTTESNIIWVTVCISCLPDFSLPDTSRNLLRAKELPWEWQTNWRRSHWTSWPCSRILAAGGSMHSLSLSRSYPKQILLALLPTAWPRQPVPLPQTWTWYSLLSHNAPLSNRTSLTLTPALHST